jgi:hypothetical protein
MKKIIAVILVFLNINFIFNATHADKQNRFKALYELVNQELKLKTDQATEESELYYLNKLKLILANENTRNNLAKKLIQNTLDNSIDRGLLLKLFLNSENLIQPFVVDLPLDGEVIFSEKNKLLFACIHELLAYQVMFSLWSIEILNEKIILKRLEIPKYDELSDSIIHVDTSAGYWTNVNAADKTFTISSRGGAIDYFEEQYQLDQDNLVLLEDIKKTCRYSKAKQTE